jgi:hypothetical protein
VDAPLARKEAAAAQIRFRRALTAGYSMWLAFPAIDWEVARHLQPQGSPDSRKGAVPCPASRASGDR